MILKKIKLNSYELGDETNCYIIADEETKEAIVIDPGGEPEKVEEMLNILGVNVKYIYLTHCHADHIGVAAQLHSAFGGKILIHRNGANNLEDDDIVLASYIGADKIVLEADSRVDDEDVIHIGNIEFKILHTPGHTNCSTSLYCKEYNMLFVGDTIFRGTWGRTDLRTSSFEDIIKSITEKIMVLPEDTIVYPGHGKSTIIKEEKPIYMDLKPRLDY
jgi:glyoxylase-like metal-dependent hydrolase (beta-lactamase superfamily II)